jgi:H+/Cl- antiporter ClcA
MKIRATRSSIQYLIAFVVIILAFMLLGGSQWFNNFAQGSRLNVVAGWNWAEILISLCLGFLLGVVVTKKNW